MQNILRKALDIEAEPFQISERNKGQGVESDMQIGVDFHFMDTGTGAVNTKTIAVDAQGEYDQLMTGIMVEMFYAKNLASHIKRGSDNAHERAKEDVKEIMADMFTNVDSGYEFDPGLVDQIIERNLSQSIYQAQRHNNDKR